MIHDDGTYDANYAAALLPTHEAYLQARGIPIELALRAGLHSVNETAAARVLGRDAALPCGGIAVPYGPLTDGGLYWRVRLDKPLHDARWLAPSHRPVPIYIPPIASDRVLDASTTLLVVEGPPKALAMCAAGYTAVALGGVDTTLVTMGRKLGPSWSTIKLQARKTIILFDAGRAINQRVARAEARLADALTATGAIVAIAALPLADGKDQGPDDYLARHGRDALAAIIDAAKPADPVERARGETATSAAVLLEDLPYMVAVCMWPEIHSQVLDELSRYGITQEAWHAAIVRVEQQLSGMGGRKVGSKGGGKAEGECGSEEKTSSAQTHKLPTITIGGNHQMRDVIGATHKLLAGVASTPLYTRDGVVVHVSDPLDAAVRIEVAKRESVYGHLVRHANWTRVSTGKTGKPVSKASEPPVRLVDDLLAYPPDSVPPLLGVMCAPTYGADGTLITATQRGYDARSRYWIAYDRKLLDEMPVVPDKPSQAQIDAARTLLVGEWLGDYPFAMPAECAHAVALAIMPFVRQLIDFVPISLVEGSVPGAGKGLLVRSASYIYLGREIAMTTWDNDEDSLRKKITALLIGGEPIINIDNVSGVIDSGQVCAAITAEMWTDRILGRSEMVHVPNRAVWCMTSNNASMSSEIARRCIRIRITPTDERPWERRQWRHPDLLGWVRENRPALVHAILTLVQAWIAAGRPEYEERTLGSFGSYCRVIGGILKVAGIDGFLGNLDAVRIASESCEDAEWREFISTWSTDAGYNWMHTTELFNLVTSKGLMLHCLGDGNERSQQIRLGITLGSMRDRVIAEHRIETARDDHTETRKYRLVVILRS